MAGIANAHEAFVPVIPGVLSGPERTFSEVASGEPPQSRLPVALDDGEVNRLPAPLGEGDHPGDDEQRDAESESDPRYDLTDDGNGVYRVHLLILEGASD